MEICRGVVYETASLNVAGGSASLLARSARWPAVEATARRSAVDAGIASRATSAGLAGGGHTHASPQVLGGAQSVLPPPLLSTKLSISDTSLNIDAQGRLSQLSDEPCSRTPGLGPLGLERTVLLLQPSGPFRSVLDALLNVLLAAAATLRPPVR